ncbi:MAG: CocE/NonD family hydrolase [Anaerolineae bacterium]
MQPKIKPVTFAARGDPAIRLEGMFHYLDGSGQWPVAVVCHPHPLGGGTMHNPVVTAIARALVSRGILTLRFNFRGVGSSQGRHDGGLGERDDVAGALDWLLDQPQVDAWRISLAGYSFGAGVGLAQAEQDPRVTAVAAVGLVAGKQETDFLAAFTRPKLFVTGEHDDLAPAADLRRLVDRLPPPKTLHVVPGIDHFWHGHEHQVAGLVADFFAAL